ncbi:M48 family metallopeptidase [Massilia glaciei]|uniref:M48 family peptidase n=1 Tax=Massilia glaciei TaxID=1524097 RepID=A0A2U2HIJ8_9BURK|nr:M48 family metallopeptidase [Massilia glaciei]PWF46646.1 M48 family peptidase [Massilia glaciei]
MKIKKIALVVSLSVFTSVAAAKDAQVVVQDGIEVKPIPGYYKLASKEKIDHEASLQYAGMLQKAEQAGALVPDDHPQVRRLRAIAARMMPYASRWNPDAAQWKWEVNLFNSKQVNAFCMPGGRIGFFSGILTTLKLTDDEVAAIMGHEVAHALREHSRGQMLKSTGTSVLARLAGAGASAWFGIDPRVTDTIAQYGSQAASLKFSRDDERESDLIGLDLAARAGFDPRAGIVLWKKMASLNKGQPPAWMSTHPGGKERIAIMNQHMNVLLPLYARAKGTTPARLPPYRGAPAAAR